MSNDFGKDLGLVHEAVVTSRKAEVGKEFWSALAHSELACRMIAPLAIHAALLEKFSMNITVVPPKDEIRKFGDWFMRATGGCGRCLLDAADFTLLGVQKIPDDGTMMRTEWEQANEVVLKEARKNLVRIMLEKLHELTISPNELEMFMEDWREKITAPANHDCLNANYLLNCLLTIRAQRQALLAIATAPLKGTHRV